MKQTRCPYKDAQNRCTNKIKISDCPFKSKEKCPTYNSWLKARKSLRMDNKALEQDIKEWLEMYKRMKVINE